MRDSTITQRWEVQTEWLWRSIVLVALAIMGISIQFDLTGGTAHALLAYYTSLGGIGGYFIVRAIWSPEYFLPEVSDDV